MKDLFKKMDNEMKKNLNELIDTKEWNIYRGKFVNAVESECNNYFLAKTLTTNSGSSAIELCLRTLGIGPGDEVIVPSFTFVATAQAVLLVGATPVLCETDKSTFNLSAENVEKKITSKTKAVIFVHLFGNPTGIDSIKQVCSKKSVYLVEDCAQGFGAELNGTKAGTFGDCGAFSFNACKHISSGDGGLFITNNKDLFKIAKGIRHAGLLEHNGIYTSHLIGGKNLMTEFQAAVLLPQLKNINQIMSNRIKNGKKIFDCLLKDGITVQKYDPKAKHVFQRVVFLARNELDANKLIDNNKFLEKVYPLALSEEPIIKKMGKVDSLTREKGLDFWRRHVSFTFLPFIDYKEFTDKFELK